MKNALKIFRKIILLFLLLFPCINFESLYSLSYGANNKITYYDSANIITGAGNEINALAVFDGVTFNDANTTCSYDAFFSMRGSVDLKNGIMFLLRDLRFADLENIISAGRIYSFPGEAHSVNFPASLVKWDYAYTYRDVSLLFDASLQLNAAWSFQNTCTINGQGNRITLGTSGEISVASGATLTLENVELEGIERTNLKCDSDDASLILKNSRIILSRDYEFATGSILFTRDVVLSGTNKFSYTTMMASTIDSYSTLYMDDSFTFSYAPNRPYRDLLFMNDDSSWLFLDGCTLHSTKTGMRLTRGKLFIDNQVTFSCEGSAASQAICFGDGTVANDLEIQLLSGAELNIYGPLEYENTI